MKYKPPKVPYRTREATPRSRRTGKKVELLCPFCAPTHAIEPNKPSPCGTIVRVVATQYVISQRYAKNNDIVCLKCGETKGGELVQCQNGYIHTHDCKPGMVVMTSAPKFSKFAEYVFKLPEKIRSKIEKRMGMVKEIESVDKSGKKTGEILGYFFYKPE